MPAMIVAPQPLATEEGAKVLQKGGLDALTLAEAKVHKCIWLRAKWSKIRPG
jgi:hypothetical protein